MSITVQTYTDGQYEVDYAAGIVGNENVNVKLRPNDVVCSDNLWPLWESCVQHFFPSTVVLQMSQPLMLLYYHFRLFLQHLIQSLLYALALLVLLPGVIVVGIDTSITTVQFCSLSASVMCGYFVTGNFLVWNLKSHRIIALLFSAIAGGVFYQDLIHLYLA